MNSLLIYAVDPLVRYDIQKLLKKYLKCEVSFAEDFKSLEFQLENRSFCLVIYDVVDFNVKEFKALRKVNKLNGHLKSLVIFETCTVTEKQLKDESKIYGISKPYLERGLVGLVKKLIKDKRTPKQKFRRYITNQVAELEALDGGLNCKMQMFNLSRGGVYFEYDGNEPLAVGEIVRVRVNLNEMLKEHVMNAKIVWTTPKGSYSGKKGIGCQFVTREEMYQHLLSRI